MPTPTPFNPTTPIPPAPKVADVPVNIGTEGLLSYDPVTKHFTNQVTMKGEDVQIVLWLNCVM
jgi:hypothetical protein